MEEVNLRDLETIFAQVEDPRVERTKAHYLRDIIIIAICGVICGAEGWVEIEEFGKAKEAWFTELLDLPNRIPSHDTFGRVFARIDPKQFEASFLEWVQGISKTVKGVIAIDGKTLRVCGQWRESGTSVGESGKHELAHRQVDERLAASMSAFIITAQATKVGHPGVRAFNDPALAMRDVALGACGFLLC